jgi:hypothetical protein
MKHSFAASLAILASAWSIDVSAQSNYSIDFESLTKAIQCFRNPNQCDGIDKNPEPEVISESVVIEPPVSRELEYDLYNRYVTDLTFDGSLNLADCPDPSSNAAKIMVDVDLDGDLDVIMGFQCFKIENNTEYLSEFITNDPYYQLVANQYLAVYINNDGVYQNDQSIFNGEYPVYDVNLKSFAVQNVGDQNGDGYPELVFVGDWDNSVWDVINQRFDIGSEAGYGCNTRGPCDLYKDLNPQRISAGSSVMISDGDGGYKVHVLPMQTTIAKPMFFEDELGDHYVWFFADKNYMLQKFMDTYDNRILDQDVRPYVGRIEGSDLIDVTWDYWDRQEFDSAQHDSYSDRVGGNPDHCYIQRSMAVNGTYPKNILQPGEIECLGIQNNINMKAKAENFQGKIYQNPTTDLRMDQTDNADPRIVDCFLEPGVRYSDREQCKVDIMTSEPWMYDALHIFAMDSKSGVYMQSRYQLPAYFRYYLADPDKPISEQGQYTSDVFMYHGDKLALLTWGWGLEISRNADDEIIIITNHGTAELDPGTDLSELDDFYRYAWDNKDVRPGAKSANIHLTNLQSLFATMEDGYCPDFLTMVEPQDCDNPEMWTQNFTDRDQTRHGESPLSQGFRVTSDGEITHEPKLSGLNLSFNAYQSHLIDFDSDGDLDLYLNDYNSECGAMCYYENLGDYEFVMRTDGVWGQALDVFWNLEERRCQGPQRPGDPNAVGGGNLCGQDSERSSVEYFLQPVSGNVTIADVDGDGDLDFYALKSLYNFNPDTERFDETLQLEVIYPE